MTQNNLELTKFNENVWSKYQIYNSIFMTLPFDDISNTGSLFGNINASRNSA
jgi:hypothetical protein